MSTDKKKKPEIKGALGKLARAGQKLEKERSEEKNGPSEASQANSSGENDENELMDKLGLNDSDVDSEGNEGSEGDSSENKGSGSKTSVKADKRRKNRKFDEIFIRDPKVKGEKIVSTALHESNYKDLEIICKVGNSSILNVLNNIVRNFREDNSEEIDKLKKQFAREILGM